MAKASVYVETSILSYLVARTSRDVIVLARQQLTRDWWANERSDYRVLVSRIVLAEIGSGDPEQASKRLDLVKDLPVLEVTAPVTQLAGWYAKQLPLPARAAADAFHLAVVVEHAVDFLLTWNCAHLANAEVRRRLRKLNIETGRHVPTICTPEELIQWNV